MSEGKNFTFVFSIISIYSASFKMTVLNEALILPLKLGPWAIFIFLVCLFCTFKKSFSFDNEKNLQRYWQKYKYASSIQTRRNRTFPILLSKQKTVSETFPKINFFFFFINSHNTIIINEQLVIIEAVLHEKKKKKHYFIFWRFKRNIRKFHAFPVLNYSFCIGNICAVNGKLKLFSMLI